MSSWPCSQAGQADFAELIDYTPGCPFHHKSRALWSNALPVWLLAVSHLCLDSNLGWGMWESGQWLGVRWWFSADTTISYTSYNWLVTTLQKYGRKSGKKPRFQFHHKSILLEADDDLSWSSCLQGWCRLNLRLR